MLQDQYEEMEALRREAFANDGQAHDWALITLCEKLYAERDYAEALNENQQWEN